MSHAAQPSRPTSTTRLVVTLTFALAALSVPTVLLIGHREAPHAFDTAQRPTLGRADAPNEIVLFVDYKCPACKAFETRELPLIQAQLIEGGEARLVALQSPFLAPDSHNAAQAAVCAQAQGAFWRMNGALFARQEDERRVWATREALTSLARDLKLNVHTFRTCLEREDARRQVEADLAQHQQAGFVGTPAVFVNGVRTDPTFTAIRAALRPER